MSIALATCARLPEPDPDQDLLLRALGAAGVEARLVPWDGPPVDWREHRLCLLRSTWNYYLRPAAFLDWLAGAERSTRVLNPPPLVRWNLHKGYLLELEAAGLPVVPTALLPRGSAVELETLCAERGWSEVVIKPAVSAASWRTRHFRRDDRVAARRFLAQTVAELDVLVQPFEPAFAREGERALVWIDGEFTHAVTKRPRYAGEDEAVSSASPLSPLELEFGRRVLAPYASELAYARVDVILGADGRLLLSELELVEPSLFLAQEPAALARLVARVGRESAS